MSKKKKTKKPGKGKNTQNIIITILAVVLIALGVSAYQLKFSEKKSSETVTAGDENSLRRGETRDTLSPALFSDTYIAETYRIAKEVPHVLDSLYCYCYCDRDPFHHVSLLSCFVDKHAAGWGICLSEARRAYELHKEGKNIKEIKKVIDKEFG